MEVWPKRREFLFFQRGGDASFFGFGARKGSAGWLLERGGEAFGELGGFYFDFGQLMGPRDKEELQKYTSKTKVRGTLRATENVLLLDAHLE